MAGILIVDDEPHIRLLIEEALEELADEGVELFTAADGDAALDIVHHQAPTLVFLDVMLARRNGYEVCRAIKGEAGLPDTTVVLLTAKGQVADREAGLEAGADHYVTKPFDPDELLALARSVVGR